MKLRVSLLLFAAACASQPAPGPALEAVPRPPHSPRQRHYVCPRAESPPTIDGRLDDTAWQTAPWTEDFVDIQGEERPKPRFRTRAKMLWDERYFYLGAQLEEPHLWATLTERDSVIFHDHDFEVFIDPDGDTHQYYELEINALGTEWDLFLVKPYRDGGPALHGWDIQGLRTATALDGTLNDPSDTDRGWSVEIAIPWAALREAAHRPAPPVPGDVWWVDFSRVEWRLRVIDGRYVKEQDPATGRPYPEDNWVWSPPGLINMHYPERWGLVQFALRSDDAFHAPHDLTARAVLRAIYYAQRRHAAAHGSFAANLARLDIEVAAPPGYQWPPVLSVSGSRFEAWLRAADGSRIRIVEDGRIERIDGRKEAR